jgi:hypothetical protein
MQKFKIYQQHNIQKICIEIFGLTTALEKPTRGKPVKGIFIFSELQRKFFYSNQILSKNSQTYFRKFLEQNSFRTTPNCSSISVPEIRTVYDCHNIKCCMDCLENLPFFLSLLYGFMCNKCTSKTDSQNLYRTASIKMLYLASKVVSKTSSTDSQKSV